MPELSLPTIGLLVVALFLGTGWYWQWRQNDREEQRDQRDREDGYEPKHEPPLHDKYATKTELNDVKARVDKLDGKIDEKFSELNDARSRSIGGLHNRIESETESLRKEIKDDIKGVHDRINAVLEAVSTLKGKLL